MQRPQRSQRSQKRRGASWSCQTTAEGVAASSRLGFELLMVFAGVTAAFAVDDWRSDRERAERVTQVNRAISQELAAFVSVGQQMYDSMAAGWQQ